MTSYEVISGVAVITIVNPPVNSLSLPVRDGITSGLSKACNDSDVGSIVIIGGGRTFPVGADISEFPTGAAFKNPLPKVINQIEACRKPVVCAIHGTAFGGGLEVALGCHYRIASTLASVGLPEVKLGILPGAGGTQRLPRLIGVWLAAEMVCKGAPVGAVEADSKGIFDELVEMSAGTSPNEEREALLVKAIGYAKSIAHKPLTGRRISELTAEPISDFFYEELARQIKMGARGMNAPLEALKAVKASATLPFKEGMQLEGRILGQLFVGPQAKALQHVFFAERQTTKLQGIDMKKARQCRVIGIVGAGTMGSGIAINFLKKGFKVVLTEQKQDYLDRGVAAIEKDFMSRVKKGKTTKHLAQKALACLHPTLDTEKLANVDMVIEAVFEDLGVKKSLLKRLDGICKPDTILCTNTSTLSIDEIASATKRPDKVIGMHFFSPANVMKLLENVKGSKTSEVTIATVMKVSKQISKTPVLVGNCFGFVANRMLFPYVFQGQEMIQEGAFPQDVDKVMYKFGFPMGPFQMSDLAGNDIGFHIRKGQGLTDPATRDPNERYSSVVADKLVELKRLGHKTGKGWYDYPKGPRKGVPSKEIMDLIVANSKSEGFTRRKISDTEIEERCLYALINEGFKCLEDGVAEKPGDIDVMWIFGFGFPPQKGGPMHYADTIGLKKVYKSVCRYHTQDPKCSPWKPAELLKSLAESGQRLDRYWAKKLRAQSNL